MSPDPTLTDVELLAAVAAGDPEAFGALYDQHSCCVRLAMIVAALGYAFLLDDPSEPTTEGVAGSLLLPATAAWWVTVVWRWASPAPGYPGRCGAVPRRPS